MTDERKVLEKFLAELAEFPEAYAFGEAYIRRHYPHPAPRKEWALVRLAGLVRSLAHDTWDWKDTRVDEANDLLHDLQSDAEGMVEEGDDADDLDYGAVAREGRIMFWRRAWREQVVKVEALKEQLATEKADREGWTREIERLVTLANDLEGKLAAATGPVSKETFEKMCDALKRESHIVYRAHPDVAEKLARAAIAALNREVKT